MGNSSNESQHFGAFLRKAREARALPIEQIADTIKVSRSSLRMLEEAQLDDLPPAVFVRGFVKSYARAIGVPVDEPVALFDAFMAERQRKKAKELLPAAPILADGDFIDSDVLVRDEDGSGQRRGVGLSILVVIVLVIATITVSYLMRQPPSPGDGLSQFETPEPDSPALDTAPGATAEGRLG